ncbi:MAG TPA: serine hydrolase domain-containing protein [Steroidobacteraceae bacterium]|nr:serine hydrolase domain-containing protein [Steroidobacteraceae bacterium]
MTTGMDQGRLAEVQETIRADIRAGLYHGAVIKVARGGEAVLEAAIGAADAAQSQPLTTGSVFNIFSVTKAFTNLLVLRAVEQGRFELTTPISTLIPEFSGRGREKILIWHLLSHQAGFPIIFEVHPGWYIDDFAEIAKTVIAEVAPVDAPCAKVAYSPLANHVLMAEALLRTDPGKRRYRQIVQQDILDPLGMRNTSVGLRPDLRPRKVVPDFRGNYPIGHKSRNTPGPNGAFEDEQAEMPWVGIVSTTPDMFKFADMFRRGGMAGTARLLSPAMIDMATRNWTGEMVNELYAARGREEGIEPAPAYIGLGFSLRGTALCHHMFGTLASPRTFGNYGAGTSLFWVDPQRDITFACLTAGVMGHNANMRRFQKLGDMVISAAE